MSFVLYYLADTIEGELMPTFLNPLPTQWLCTSLLEKGFTQHSYKHIIRKRLVQSHGNDVNCVKVIPTYNLHTTVRSTKDMKVILLVEATNSRATPIFNPNQKTKIGIIQTNMKLQKNKSVSCKTHIYHISYAMAEQCTKWIHSQRHNDMKYPLIKPILIFM